MSDTPGPTPTTEASTKGNPPPLEAVLASNQQLQQQYVYGGYIAALQAIRAVLPQYVDDVQRDFGDDVYDRMLTDPIVRSSLDTLIYAILADGIRVESAIPAPADLSTATNEEVADYERAEELRAFVERCVADGSLEGLSLHEVAKDMLRALAFGCRVAEITLKEGSGIDSGKLVLRCIKPKKRLSTAFVIDSFGTVLGLVAGTALSAGKVLLTGGIYFENFGDIQPFVPRDKCLIFSNDQIDNFPTGQSLLRAAYTPWYIKTQVVPEYYKYLRQFATPGVIGFTPPDGPGLVTQTDANGIPIYDALNNPLQISAEQAMLNAIINWQNGMAMAFRGGSDVKLIMSQGESNAFGDGFDYFDRQITMAVLGTTRLTMEARHGSKADSGTAQDVVGLRVAFLKHKFASVLTRDLSIMLIRVNFGEEAVRFAPRFELSQIEQQDVTARVTAYAQAYAQGFIQVSQLPKVYAELGLPPADMAALMKEKQEQLALDRLQAQQLGALASGPEPSTPIEALKGDAFEEGENE